MTAFILGMPLVITVFWNFFESAYFCQLSTFIVHWIRKHLIKKKKNVRELLMVQTDTIILFDLSSPLWPLLVKQVTILIPPSVWQRIHPGSRGNATAGGFRVDRTLTSSQNAKSSLGAKHTKTELCLYLLGQLSGKCQKLTANSPPEARKEGLAPFIA